MTTRILPFEEWPQLSGALAAIMPDNRPLYQHLDPERTKILVVEKPGISGFCAEWALTPLWHAEGCTMLDPNPAVSRALLRGMAALMADLDLPGVYTGAESSQVSSQLERLGARAIPVTSYYLPALGRAEEHT